MKKDPHAKSAQGNHGSHSSHFSGDICKHIYRIIEKCGRGLIKLTLYEEYTCGYVATVATYT